MNTVLRLVPFLSAQLIQLRRFCICTGIFLDHIGLRGQYIKIAATAVFNLHVVFDDLIYFNLLNTPVNAQSMTFMHHKIAHIQICKALNLRTFIGMTFLSFFLFSSKNIAFCQYRKTDQWIFIAMMQIAISHHDFSRLNLPIPVIRIKAVQLIFLQIRSQALRSGSGSRQQCNAVSFFFPLLQILHQLLKTVVIRIHRPYRHTVSTGNIPFISRYVHNTQPQTISPVQTPNDLHTTIEQICLRWQNIPLIQTILHTLRKFFFYCGSFLTDSIRFIQKNHGIFF